jgi:SsrA-binding protein
MDFLGVVWYNSQLLMKKEEKIVASNRQARHNYNIIESYEAGIVLAGAEVKSAREGKVNLKDSFAVVGSDGLYLHNCHISPYKHATAFAEEPKRKRKLLMHKAQIMRLLGKTGQKGYTLVPLKMYITHGLCKVELALATGKKLYDKRQSIKEKAARRELKKEK